MDDLNRAIELANMAVEATPPNHPDRAGWVTNLGSLLGRRFEQTAAMGDLNRGVEAAGKASVNVDEITTVISTADNVFSRQYGSSYFSYRAGEAEVESARHFPMPDENPNSHFVVTFEGIDLGQVEQSSTDRVREWLHIQPPMEAFGPEADTVVCLNDKTSL
jgi:hypothetical protein